MTAERWLPAPGFLDYWVSNLGRVGSTKLYHGSTKFRVLSQVRNPKHGYMQVQFRDAEGKRRHLRVHRLVGDAFLGPIHEGMLTRHLNGDQTDNRLDNLRHGTPAENNADTVLHHRHQAQQNELCSRGHEYDKVRIEGGRQQRACRQCASIRANLRRRARGIKPLSTVSDEDALVVISRANAGERQADLAAEYGISAALVSMWRTGKARPHLTADRLADAA